MKTEVVENLEEQSKLHELNLDAKQVKEFLRYRKTLPKDSRAVRFFGRGDYYTAHGADIDFIKMTYYQSTSIQWLGKGRLSLRSLAVTRDMFVTIARDILLVRIDRTLELYEGSGSTWGLVKSGTPGNLAGFEDILFANNEMHDSPVLVALVPNFYENGNGCTFGLGYVNVTKRVLGYAEFPDDCFCTKLESTLVGVGCRECLVPKSQVNGQIRDVISRCGVMLTIIEDTKFISSNLACDLDRLVKYLRGRTNDFVTGLKSAAGALGCILSYAELVCDSNSRNYRTEPYEHDSYMRLDSASMEALNVMDSKSDATKRLSLLYHMNRTCTPGMGERCLRMWLRQPRVQDLNEINGRLDIVQVFVDNNVLREKLRQHLKGISDIERLILNLERKRASLVHIRQLYQSSIKIPQIKHVLEEYGTPQEEIRRRYIDPLQKWSNNDDLNKFIHLVGASVVLDRNRECMLSSKKLSTLKADQEAIEQKINNLHKQTAIELDIPIKLVKGTNFNHIFKITKKEEEKPGVGEKLNSHYIVLQTHLDGAAFTTEELRELGNEYKAKIHENKKHQEELEASVVQTATGLIEVFNAIADSLSKLDVLLSFADLAASCPNLYTRPNMSPLVTGDIILEGCRPPRDDCADFTPNDYRLVRGQKSFQMITGPKKGGKSTYIQQVAVNTLMAQVGSFIPCKKAVISVRDCIFARVGVGDCQPRGVSTFMQEMLKTASILKGATDRSLIIIDGLGCGTLTKDCFNLTWAICELLAEAVKAPTLCATDSHQLTSLASKHPTWIANLHMSARRDCSSNKLTMSYQVKSGACPLAREDTSEWEDLSPIDTICRLPLGKIDLNSVLQKLARMTNQRRESVDCSWLLKSVPREPKLGG